MTVVRCYYNCSTNVESQTAFTDTTIQYGYNTRYMAYKNTPDFTQKQCTSTVFKINCFGEYSQNSIILWEITHLAVKAFKYGTFEFCLLSKDLKSEGGQLIKSFHVALNNRIHLTAHISGLAWLI
jgi:hypothetical protein